MVTVETVTHVAGPYVQIGDRVIQRCAVCGEKLADTFEPNSDGTVAVWNEGVLVRFRKSHQKNVGDFNNCKSLPRDFCITLVETWPIT